MEPVISSFVERKLVKVTDSGPIMPLGGIYGPTLPQILSTKIVAVLLQKGYHVTEILNNKSEVKLTLTNYNLDLNGDGGKKLREFKRPTDEISILPKMRREAPKPRVEEKPVVEDTELKAAVIPPETEVKPKTENKITVTTPEGGKAEADTKRDEPKSGGLMSTTKKNKPKADELISK